LFVLVWKGWKWYFLTSLEFTQKLLGNIQHLKFKFVPLKWNSCHVDHPIASLIIVIVRSHWITLKKINTSDFKLFPITGFYCWQCCEDDTYMVSAEDVHKIRIQQGVIFRPIFMVKQWKYDKYAEVSSSRVWRLSRETTSWTKT
jgi:hypothetical protein